MKLRTNLVRVLCAAIFVFLLASPTMAAPAVQPLAAGTCTVSVNTPFTGYRLVNGVSTYVVIGKATTTCTVRQSITTNVTIQRVVGGQVVDWSNWSATCNNSLSCTAEAWYVYSAGTWYTYGSSPLAPTPNPKSKTF